jgi:hypothetical protein
MIENLYVAYLMGHYSNCNKNYESSGIWWELWKIFFSNKDKKFKIDFYFKEINNFCIDFNFQVPISFESFEKEYKRLNGK